MLISRTFLCNSRKLIGFIVIGSNACGSFPHFVQTSNLAPKGLVKGLHKIRDWLHKRFISHFIQLIVFDDFIIIVLSQVFRYGIKHRALYCIEWRFIVKQQRSVRFGCMNFKSVPYKHSFISDRLILSIVSYLYYNTFYIKFNIRMLYLSCNFVAYMYVFWF